MRDDLIASVIIGAVAISVAYCVYCVSEYLSNDEQPKVERVCECGRAVEPEVIIKKYNRFTPIIIRR